VTKHRRENHAECVKIFQELCFAKAEAYHNPRTGRKKPIILTARSGGAAYALYTVEPHQCGSENPVARL